MSKLKEYFSPESFASIFDNCINGKDALRSLYYFLDRRARAKDQEDTHPLIYISERIASKCAAIDKSDIKDHVVAKIFKEASYVGEKIIVFLFSGGKSSGLNKMIGFINLAEEKKAKGLIDRNPIFEISDFLRKDISSRHDNSALETLKAIFSEELLEILRDDEKFLTFIDIVNFRASESGVPDQQMSEEIESKLLAPARAKKAEEMMVDSPAAPYVPIPTPFDVPIPTPFDVPIPTPSTPPAARGSAAAAAAAAAAAWVEQQRQLRQSPAASNDISAPEAGYNSSPKRFRDNWSQEDDENQGGAAEEGAMQEEDAGLYQQDSRQNEQQDVVQDPQQLQQQMHLQQMLLFQQLMHLQQMLPLSVPPNFIPITPTFVPIPRASTPESSNTFNSPQSMPDETPLQDEEESAQNSSGQIKPKKASKVQNGQEQQNSDRSPS